MVQTVKLLFLFLSPSLLQTIILQSVICLCTNSSLQLKGEGGEGGDGEERKDWV